MPQRVESGRAMLSTAEACQVTGFSPAYIQRLLREERIEGFKLGSVWHIYEDSLEAFTSQTRKRGPKGPRKKTMHVDREKPSTNSGSNHLSEQ
jgi:excisionase family DNA binding protein